MSSRFQLDNAWVAIQTHIRSEKRAAEYLVLHGYECFLPLQRKNEYGNTSIQKAGGQRLMIPLFPGYLFCRYKMRHSFRIEYAPAVIRVLRYDDIPIVVPDSEIESLFKIVTSGYSADACSFFQAGQKVRVKHGPLRGTEGYLVSVNKNTCKIAFRVSAVEKFVIVNVSNVELAI